MDGYADIMLHGRYRLRSHRVMAQSARAAQFSSFAALTGFEDEISETARLTDPRSEMTLDDLAELNDAFRRMLENGAEHPAVTVTYFEPDAHKQGGAYLTYHGCFRHYDAADGILYFTGGQKLQMRNICAITFDDEQT